MLGEGKKKGGEGVACSGVVHGARSSGSRDRMAAAVTSATITCHKGMSFGR
jgi:hypothetical protein